MNAIDTWIAIHADNTATVYIGKGEFGQGNTTGLLQIAAEELDLDMSQVRSVQLDTNVVPNQGARHFELLDQTAVARKWRVAAAEARRALLNASAKLRMQIGKACQQRRRVDRWPSDPVLAYGALLGDKPFNVKFTGTAPQKAITRYKVVGTDVPRVPRQGSRQVHPHAARAAWPVCCTAAWSGRAASAPMALARQTGIDEASIKEISARIVRKGDFIGVVAENEWEAIRASRALKVTWQETPALPGNADLFTRLRAAKTSDVTIVDWGDADKAFKQAAHVSASTYYCPYQSHAPFGPNCAIGNVGPNGALVKFDPGYLQHARHAGGGARAAGRQGARTVCRRLRHLRPKLLRRLCASRSSHVASGGQAGARTVHAL